MKEKVKGGGKVPKIIKYSVIPVGELAYTLYHMTYPLSQKLIKR